ncbi:hypothetical protein [Nostoc sp. TCL26-01]|uniref:hypothetical protein n=1 Tax=Nostoc sp. TCL26-01 TaxID=2576904 RepID=UPI0015BBEE74|nr:hypothetical protein [Nostoc sp. TCL26-01]QLE55470.1 hypothetical protein FD725_08040 [Nostoc sp. TCL26-01]
MITASGVKPNIFQTLLSGAIALTQYTLLFSSYVKYPDLSAPLNPLLSHQQEKLNFIYRIWV